MTEISKIQRNAQNIIQHIIKGECKRPVVNILFVGADGVGKSALANSLVMVLDKRGYKKIVPERHENVTLSLETYTLHKHLEELRPPNLPINTDDGEDVPENGGTELYFHILRISDEKADYIETVLDFIISGKRPKETWDEVVKPGANLMKAFSTPNPSLKIHLVCYLYAAPDTVSQHLVQSVGSAALNRKREIPVFLIITKKDLLTQEKEEQDSFKDRKEDIMMKLSMGGIEERVFELSLHCNGAAPDLEKNPDTYEKLCELWLALVDPIYCNRNTDSYVWVPKSSSKFHDGHDGGTESNCNIL